MNKPLKYILLSICGGVIAFCIVCSYIAGDRLRHECICEKLEVKVLDSLHNQFVTAGDIRKVLDKTYGQYIGVHVDSLDLVKIEDIVDRRSAVLKSEVYMTMDGTLHIDITQRRPAARFQKKDGGFYADKDGYIFPLQSSFASHVQIIDGHIPLAANSGYKGELTDPVEKAWIEKIMGLVNYIEASDEWRNMIVQIHVTENTDLILIPREGRERFVFGQPEYIAEKFERMKKYYTAVIPEKGSDKYKEVDLRFKGQIICR